MPRAAAVEDTHVPTRPARRVIKKFAAPDSLPDECGAYTVREGELDGFILTEHIPLLLDAFGVTDRRATEFPFQVIVRRDGDIHRLRIAKEDFNDVDGKVIRSHRWIYEQKAKDQY